MTKITKKLIRLFTVLTVLLLTLGNIYSFAAAGDRVTVAFVHDTHSRVETQKPTEGDVARLAAALNEVRTEDPETLVLDGGDFAMGTLYQSLYETHALELRFLGKLGVDATTFGNHEFDYGSDGLARMLRSAAASEDADTLPILLGGNIDWEASTGEHTADLKAAMEEYGTQETVIIEKNGVKIGLFGIMGINAAACAPESGLTWMEPAEGAKKAVDALKAQGAELIIALSHSGTSEEADKSEDELLALAVPEIDLILSAHSHTTLEEPLVLGDTTIVSAGCYMRNLGVISMERNGDRWAFANYELRDLTSGVAPDPATLAEVEEYRSLLSEYTSVFGYEDPQQVIAYNPHKFPTVEEMGDSNEEQPMGELIADAYMDTLTKMGMAVDVVAVPIGVVRDNLPQGEVTVSNVYDISSLGQGKDGLSGYPLIEVYLTGEELWTVAEIDASVSLLMPEAKLYVSGLGYSFNPNRLILNRVTDVWLDTPEGRVEIDKDRLYCVIGGYYTGLMLGAAEDASFGLVKLGVKNAAGELVTNLEDTIIHAPDGSEVKEWNALAQYLASFEENEDGLPQVPEKYGAPLGRRIVENSKNPMELLKNPNHIGIMVGALVLAVILIIVLIVVLLRRRFGRRREK